MENKPALIKTSLFRLRRILNLRQLIYIPLSLIFFFAIFYYLTRLIEPTSPIQNLFVTNISDQQVSLTWITQKPTKGEVVISEDGKFPLLPILGKKTYKDDGEKNLNRTGFYTTHQITINELTPNKTYQYLIYQGWKKVYQGSFKTAPTLSSLSAPNPVYGRVLSSDKKSPAVGAIVYLQAKTGKNSSALLSTLTNIEGRWSVDLGNLRTKDLKLNFKVSSSSAEQVVVESGTKGKFKATTAFGKDKPWPDIILGI